MNKKTLFLLALCFVMIWGGGSKRADAQDTSMANKLVGKWTQHYTGMKLEGAVLTITSVDPSTGAIKGKWVPPSGAGNGKEFDVTGWVSSAPFREKLDNVVTISFTVNITVYGSMTSYTGYFKDNKITVSWFNVKPVSTYEWDHISTGQDYFTKNS